MKTIDDLPIEILTHILFFTTPYIDMFVKLRLINSKWNKAVKHRLSRVKHLIQDLDDRFNRAPIRAETMFSIEPECSYFDDSDWDDKYTRYFISLMEMLPGLQAVDMENPHRFCKDGDSRNQYPYPPHDPSIQREILSIQNEIFSYFNSRPTIKALGVHIGFPWDDYDIKSELEEAVKLRNITLLSIKGDESLVNCKQFIEYFFPTDHEFEQLWLHNDTHVSYIFQRMPKIRKLYHQVAWQWPKGNELDLIMPNHLRDLEIFGVSSHQPDILEYLSKVTSVCPKLTSIHLVLSRIDQKPIKNFKKFNQIENLVISTESEPWPYVEKILRMYPMVKNLSIKYSSDLSQDKILGIFQWMPNLSILHLVHSKYIRTKEVPWTVDVDNLVSAYNQLHGRLIKIRVEKNMEYYDYTRIIFKRGFDFMKHIFYSDDFYQPHLLLE